MLRASEVAACAAIAQFVQLLQRKPKRCHRAGRRHIAPMCCPPPGGIFRAALVKPVVLPPAINRAVVNHSHTPNIRPKGQTTATQNSAATSTHITVNRKRCISSCCAVNRAVAGFLRTPNLYSSLRGSQLPAQCLFSFDCGLKSSKHL